MISNENDLTGAGDEQEREPQAAVPPVVLDIYNYSNITGEFLSRGVADANPLQPDDPIIPGYATKEAPPSPGEGRIAVFRTLPEHRAQQGAVPQNWPFGAWTIAPDYRQISLYRTADGSPFTLGTEYNGIGDLPPFLTDEPRPSPAHVWLNDEWTLDEALETSQLVVAATAKRDSRLAEADQLIAPLMDGFVLDELTSEDEARLKALSQYRKALRAVTSQAGFPRAINWPVKPA